MQIAVLLFEELATLDAVGPYEILSRLPGAESVFVGEQRGIVHNDVGNLGLVVEASLGEVPDPDVIVVPGGFGQRAHMSDGVVHEWLRGADQGSTWTTSVCTGSLILASAGLLTGRRATTHWLAMDQLPGFGVLPESEKIVFDGKYVTAAGVSAGIDMALTLLGHLAGDAVAQRVQLGMGYDPQPPYDSGSPLKAPSHIVDLVRANRTAALHP